MMIDDGREARDEYDNLCARTNAMIDLLKKHGGLEALKTRTKKLLAKRKFSYRFLRDF
jgi:hypothetical protein